MRRMSLLLCLILILFPVAAQANGLPAGWTNPPGFDLSAVESESVSIIREVLTYDLSQSNMGYFAPDADVTATYWMQTDSLEPETVTMVFVYVGHIMYDMDEEMFVNATWDQEQLDIQLRYLPELVYYNFDGGEMILIEDTRVNKSPSFQDILNSLNKSVSPEEAEYYWDYYGDAEKHILDPDSKEEHVYLSWGVKLLLFDITLEPGTTHELMVNFPQIATRERTTFSVDYSFLYYLEPASYWKSFNDLTIEVLVPRGYKLHSSNLELTNVDSNRDYTLWQGQFPNLPEENLLFSVRPRFPKSLSYGSFLNNLFLYIVFLGCILIIPLGLVAFVLLVRWFYKKPEQQVYKDFKKL